MAQDGLEAIAEVEQEGIQENGVDEVFDRAEQEVMSFLPEMMSIFLLVKQPNITMTGQIYQSNNTCLFR